MWSALFGYPGSVTTAMVERLVVVLTAGPWLVLVAAVAPRPRSRTIAIAQAVLLVLMLDRLMVDFRFWAMIALIMAAGWPLISARWTQSATERSSDRSVSGVWLMAGLALLVLVMNAGPMPPVRCAVLLFVLSGLSGSGASARSTRSVMEDGAVADSTAGSRSGWLARTCLHLMAALPLCWSVPDFTPEVFPQLLLAGMMGWTGLHFHCWRAGRAAPRRPPLLRTASWLCGLTAGFLFAVLVGELYFRYIYDASDPNGDLRTARRWGERHVRFNRSGYRDCEFPPAAELGDLTRIVLLGDSFAFGWGIADQADLLGPRLERELSGRISPPPRVFTLAKGGIDTRREIELFRRDGVPLKPRAVVLTYHLNDTEGLLPRPRIAAASPSPAWRPITENSDFIEFFLWHASVRRSAGRATLLDLPGLAAYQDPALFARQARDLLVLIEVIREAAARPVVMLYPYLNAPTRDGPQRSALDRVDAVLAEAGVPVIDVSRLVDVNDRRFHANSFDAHPGPALHAAVVPILAETLVKTLGAWPATAPAGSNPGRPPTDSRSLPASSR